MEKYSIMSFVVYVFLFNGYACQHLFYQKMSHDVEDEFPDKEFIESGPISNNDIGPLFLRDANKIEKNRNTGWPPMGRYHGVLNDYNDGSSSETKGSDKSVNVNILIGKDKQTGSKGVQSKPSFHIPDHRFLKEKLNMKNNLDIPGDRISKGYEPELESGEGTKLAIPDHDLFKGYHPHQFEPDKNNNHVFPDNKFLKEHQPQLESGEGTKLAIPDHDLLKKHHPHQFKSDKNKNLIFPEHGFLKKRRRHLESGERYNIAIPDPRFLKEQPENLNFENNPAFPDHKSFKEQPESGIVEDENNFGFLDNGISKLPEIDKNYYNYYEDAIPPSLKKMLSSIPTLEDMASTQNRRYYNSKVYPRLSDRLKRLARKKFSHASGREVKENRRENSRRGNHGHKRFWYRLDDSPMNKYHRETMRDNSILHKDKLSKLLYKKIKDLQTVAKQDDFLEH